jgi:serine/threonine-protein kinase
MELLEGESLDARLHRLGRVPVMDVLRLTRQLALSLFAAHQRGVIHRDLKPENIFVVPDLEVFGGERTKILDFGIAKLTDLESSRLRTQTGLMMGTPVYMSPEQCRGAGSIDHRADVYSLGCVMFQMLTGRPPFDHEGGGELIAAHLKEIAPAPSTIVAVQPAVDAIVARCLAKEPHERFATMHELAADLDHVLRTGSIALSSSILTPIPPEPTFAPRRARWPLVFAAAMIVGLGGATAAALVIRHGSSDVAQDEGTSIAAPARPVVVAPVVSKPAPTPSPAPPTPAPPPPQVTPTPPMPATTKSPTPPIVHKRHVLPPRPAPKQDTGSATAPTPPPPTDPYDDR